MTEPIIDQTLTTETAAPNEIIQQQTSNQDYIVLRIAVVGLIIAVIITLISVSVLAWSSRTLPDGVLAIGSAAVGALSTMLVRPSSYTK